MQRSILAARTQQAIEKIATETARLGGQLNTQAAVVRGDTEHRQLALLEAIGTALEGIPSAPMPTAVAEAPAKKSAKGKEL